MCSGGGDGGAAARARAEEEARQERVRKGTASIDRAFSGFDNSFYQNRQKAYLDYATPQLADQYRQAQDALAFNLARKGLTGSSEMGKGVADLTRQHKIARSSLESNALNMANEARKNVESNRSDLLGQLTMNANADLAASQSLARADVLSSTPGFSPIGKLFENTTGLLGNAATAQAYNPNARGMSGYTDLFTGGSKGSSKIVKT
jgi:hypothetical protein